MEVTRTSRFSGKTTTRNLPICQGQLDEYANGALIQDAFPNLGPDDREFIMTGITKEEWDQMFGDEEDEV